MPNKQRLVDSEFTRQQYTVHKIFYVRTFAKYRRSAGFNYISPYLTAHYKKVEQIQWLFLVVWQTVWRSMMQIYWKIGLLWYGAPTGGAANVLLELIFGQKRQGAILEFFSKFDRSWNKN